MASPNFKNVKLPYYGNVQHQSPVISFGDNFNGVQYPQGINMNRKRRHSSYSSSDEEVPFPKTIKIDQMYKDVTRDNSSAEVSFNRRGNKFFACNGSSAYGSYNASNGYLASNDWDGDYHVSNASSDNDVASNYSGTRSNFDSDTDNGAFFNSNIRNYEVCTRNKNDDNYISPNTVVEKDLNKQVHATLSKDHKQSHPSSCNFYNQYKHADMDDSQSPLFSSCDVEFHVNNSNDKIGDSPVNSNDRELVNNRIALNKDYAKICSAHGKNPAIINLNINVYIGNNRSTMEVVNGEKSLIQVEYAGFNDAKNDKGVTDKCDETCAEESSDEEDTDNGNDMNKHSVMIELNGYEADLDSNDGDNVDIDIDMW